MGSIEEGLVLQVRLLPEPCLWCWEIRNGVDGRLVESSWAHAWVAFGSRTQAAAAGARRLARLAAAGSAAQVGASSRRPLPRVAPEPTRRAG